jgi:hypothetical protein
MAGLPMTKADLDRVLGNAVVAAAQALGNVVALDAMLNDPARVGGEAGLEALAYTPTEAGLVMASYADLTAYAAVGAAGQPAPGPNDYWFHAKLLMGTVPLPVLTPGQ